MIMTFLKIRLIFPHFVYRKQLLKKMLNELINEGKNERMNDYEQKQ